MQGNKLQPATGPKPEGLRRTAGLLGHAIHIYPSATPGGAVPASSCPPPVRKETYGLQALHLSKTRTRKTTTEVLMLMQPCQLVCASKGMSWTLGLDVLRFRRCDNSAGMKHLLSGPAKSVQKAPSWPWLVSSCHVKAADPLAHAAACTSPLSHEPLTF